MHYERGAVEFRADVAFYYKLCLDPSRLWPSVPFVLALIRKRVIDGQTRAPITAAHGRPSNTKRHLSLTHHPVRLLEFIMRLEGERTPACPKCEASDMVLTQRIIRGPHVITEYLCGRCWFVWTIGDPRKKSDSTARRIDEPNEEES